MSVFLFDKNNEDIVLYKGLFVPTSNNFNRINSSDDKFILLDKRYFKYLYSEPREKKHMEIIFKTKSGNNELSVTCDIYLIDDTYYHTIYHDNNETFSYPKQTYLIKSINGVSFLKEDVLKEKIKSQKINIKNKKNNTIIEYEGEITLDNDYLIKIRLLDGKYKIFNKLSHEIHQVIPINSIKSIFIRNKEDNSIIEYNGEIIFNNDYLIKIKLINDKYKVFNKLTYETVDNKSHTENKNISFIEKDTGVINKIEYKNIIENNDEYTVTDFKGDVYNFLKGFYDKVIDSNPSTPTNLQGFKNLGNTCYISSFLVSLKPFISYIIDSPSSKIKSLLLDIYNNFENKSILEKKYLDFQNYLIEKENEIRKLSNTPSTIRHKFQKNTEGDPIDIFDIIFNDLRISKLYNILEDDPIVYSINIHDYLNEATFKPLNELNSDDAKKIIELINIKNSVLCQLFINVYIPNNILIVYSQYNIPIKGEYLSFKNEPGNFSLNLKSVIYYPENHYMCYINKDNNWFCYNDSIVTKVNITDRVGRVFLFEVIPNHINDNIYDIDESIQKVIQLFRYYPKVNCANPVLEKMRILSRRDTLNNLSKYMQDKIPINSDNIIDYYSYFAKEYLKDYFDFNYEFECSLCKAMYVDNVYNVFIITEKNDLEINDSQFSVKGKNCKNCNHLQTIYPISNYILLLFQYTTFVTITNLEYKNPVATFKIVSIDDGEYVYNKDLNNKWYYNQGYISTNINENQLLRTSVIKAILFQCSYI